MSATHERQGRREEAPSAFRDEVVRFGPEEQLVGIVSRPAILVPSGPGAMILNAGVLHRVGPHRLHVVLARRLAALGIPSLRLDLGGIGDSVASSDAATFRESAVADTRLAMTGFDELVGPRRHVLLGICAGADNALAVALADDRVAAIVLVDPYSYASRQGRLRAIRAKLTRLGPRASVRWGLAVAGRRLRAQIARLGQRGEEPPAEGREPPPIATFRAQLTALVERGVGILAVYSGIHGDAYNAPDQLFELFPELRGRVDRAYFPTANHTFTELAAQAELVSTISTWIATRFR